MVFFWFGLFLVFFSCSVVVLLVFVCLLVWVFFVLIITVEPVEGRREILQKNLHYNKLLLKVRIESPDTFIFSFFRRAVLFNNCYCASTLSLKFYSVLFSIC